MKKRKVLVVEDQPSLALALRTMLERHDCLVRVEGNGKLGVEAALEWIPDVVLMDLSMPVMNGFDATAAIRSDERTRWIPVMATTALDRPEEVLRALLCGFNRYLRKPYREADLIAHLEELVTLSERQRKLAAISPTPGQGEGLIEIGQILVELIGTLQQRLRCDLFAVAWGGAEPGLLVTGDLEEFVPELVAQVEMLAWGEEPAGPIPSPTLVGVEGSCHRAPERLGSAVAVPLEISRETAGVFILGTFDEHEYDEHEMQIVGDLAPSVADVLRYGVVVTSPEPEVDDLMQEIRVLLVMPGPDAESYADAMETALPGLRVAVVGSPDEMDHAQSDVQLALVDEALYDAFEAAQLRRSRQGYRAIAGLQLEPGQLTQPEERLAAFLLMSVMIGITDSASTGCLHLQRQGGAPVGLMVFKEGQMAWATSSTCPAHLLGVLSEVAGREVREWKAVAKRSVLQAASFFEAVVGEGLATAEQCTEALKTYITMVVGDLLRQTQPKLFWSRQVRVGPDDPTFDAAEIMMSSFGT